MTGILCLETEWYDAADGYTVSSIFPAIEMAFENKAIYNRVYTCGTPEELALRLQNTKRLNRFGVLVLAFHGHRGAIETESLLPIKLPELAHLMRDRFQGFYIHFSSCKTFNTDMDDILFFKNQVGARAVSGYTSSPGWSEDYSALELILLCNYLRGRRLPDKRYKRLMQINGLVVV